MLTPASSVLNQNGNRHSRVFFSVTKYNFAISKTKEEIAGRKGQFVSRSMSCAVVIAFCPASCLKSTPGRRRMSNKSGEMMSRLKIRLWNLAVSGWIINL